MSKKRKNESKKDRKKRCERNEASFNGKHKNKKIDSVDMYFDSELKKTAIMMGILKS